LSHPRLTRAMNFVENDLREQYHRERAGWHQFYDLLDALDDNQCAKAIEIIDSCVVRT
jgi:hypothetical protein